MSEEIKETVAQEALRLLSPIPYDQWIKDVFTDEKGACCAIGHYTRLKSKNPNDYGFLNCRDFNAEENPVLRDSSCKFIQEKYDIKDTIAGVNNTDEINGYNEPEIKDRVIHLLEDMVKAGY